MKQIILILSILVLSNLSWGNQDPARQLKGENTISSKLSNLDHQSIPVGSEYEFKVNIQYSQIKKTKRENDGAVFRQYESEATFVAVAPALAYLGRASLEIAKWVPLFCSKEFKSQGYTHNSYQIEQNQNGTQTLKFQFQCLGSN